MSSKSKSKSKSKYVSKLRNHIRNTEKAYGTKGVRAWCVQLLNEEQQLKPITGGRKKRKTRRRI